MKKKAFKKIIKGERITLRKTPCTKEQAELAYKILQKNKTHLLPWMQWVHEIKNSRDVYKYIIDNDKLWKNKEEANYGIYLNNEYIGDIWAPNIDYYNDSCKIGYWIDADQAKKGYVTEAIKLLESELFNRGINRIEMTCDSDNIASYNLMEKCGYTCEGIIRQGNFYREGDGEYRNKVVYSKLYHEWEYENE